MATVSTPVVYIEGIVYKRSRGRHPSRVKKTQKRFCRLTKDSFDYYEPPKKGDTVPNKAPKGNFPVSRIRIVEKLDFKKGEHWFQFGDDKEVIYLGAKSEDRQYEWIKALKKAAAESHNEMISHYHPEPYTGGRWNCCKEQTKQCQGCEPVHSAESDADDWHSRQTLHQLSFTSNSSEETVTEFLGSKRPSQTSTGSLSCSQQSTTTLTSVSKADSGYTSHQPRLRSDLSFTSNSSEETITESLGSKRPPQTSTGSLSCSQQSTTTLTVSENEVCDHENDDKNKEQETTHDKPLSDDVSKSRAGSVADSGLGSELNSRTSSESVGPGKKRSIEKTRSLGVVLDEDVAEPNDLSKKHQSQPNLYSTSYKSEPGHKESLLPGQQVLSKLSNKLQGSTLDSLYEEEEQADVYTPFQCFTSPTQNQVQALEFYGPDKLISTSYSDSYVHIWDVSGFKPVQSVKVSSSVLALDVWSHYLAIGSSVVQMVDLSSDELRRIIFVEDSEGIPSSPLPSHFVAFVGEEGHLATARADSTVVKVWSPPPKDSKIITSPEGHIPLTGQIQGLSATHSSQVSLLAVTIEKKEDEKAVCLIDWKKHEDYKIIASSGNSSVSIHIAFSPDARQVSTGIGQKVDIWETGSGAKLHHFNTDAVVCSVLYSHDGSKLAVGLSTAEVNVFDPMSNHHLFTLSDPVTCTEGSSPATALAYSKDDKVFATGHQNGVLKLWKGSLDATSHCLRNPLSSVYGMGPELYNDLEPLLARVETIHPQFNENGIYEYHSVDDDFNLIIPKGAIVGDHKVQVAVMKYGPIGPFEYPDGYKPISPIIWLCSTQEKFDKDLEIILPHCSDLGDSDEEASQTQLVFLKASHEYICNKNGQKVLQFKQVDAQPSFNPNDPYGSLHINHCCFYCVGEYNRKDTDQANFCLIVAKPHTTDSKYTISICLTLDLPTCEKAVREQFEECDFEKICPVRFAKNTQDATLEIKTNRQVAAMAGWLITIKSQKKIKARDVSGFWDFPSCGDLVRACNNKSYPPRFVLEVSAKAATMNTYLEVRFEGTVDELCTEFQLECPTESPKSQPAVYVGPSGGVVLQNPHEDGMESENPSPGINGISENENSEAPPGLPPTYKHFNGQWVPPNNPH